MVEQLLAGIGLHFATKFITFLGGEISNRVIGKDIDRRIAGCYRDSVRLLYEECHAEGWSKQRLEAMLNVLNLDDVQEIVANVVSEGQDDKILEVGPYFAVGVVKEGMTEAPPEETLRFTKDYIEGKFMVNMKRLIPQQIKGVDTRLLDITERERFKLLQSSIDKLLLGSVVSPKKIDLTVDSSQSGSIFVDLRSGERRRFGNNDTKHNNYCWVGRYSYSVCKSFICFDLNIDQQVRDSVGQLNAIFFAPDYEVREKDDIYKLGPLILYYFDYDKYSAAMDLDVMDNGIKLHTMEEITDLKLGIDISNSMRRAIKKSKTTYKVALVYPGEARDERLNCKILVNPEAARISLTF